MYFMQAAGEPLRLRFHKAPYGPYAENLRYVLARIEGRLVTGYGDGGDGPSKQLEVLRNAVEAAQAFLRNLPDVRARLDRVSNLVDGFESEFGLELLATVHWVAENEQAMTIDEIRKATLRCVFRAMGPFHPARPNAHRARFGTLGRVRAWCGRRRLGPRPLGTRDPSRAIHQAKARRSLIRRFT